MLRRFGRGMSGRCALPNGDGALAAHQGRTGGVERGLTQPANGDASRAAHAMAAAHAELVPGKPPPCGWQNHLRQGMLSSSIAPVRGVLGKEDVRREPSAMASWVGAAGAPAGASAAAEEAAAAAACSLVLERRES